MTQLAWSPLAVMALALAASPAAAQVIGVSAAVKNDVRSKKPGAPLPRPVQVKDRVALADQLQTGAKSQLQVLLLDKSVFTVGANARLTVDRYIYDPNSSSRSLGATVAKGAFRFMSGTPDRGTDSQIRTPVATIGIRGTIIEGVVGEDAALIAAGERAVGGGVRSDPATASLIILRGPGNATQGNVLPGSITVTAGGRTVAVDHPMLAVYVPGPGMAPIGPFRISQAALVQIQALLYPSVADRLGLQGPADNLGTGEARGTYFPPPGEGPAYPSPYSPGGYPPGAFPPGGFGPNGSGPGGGGRGVGVSGFPSPNLSNIRQGGPPPQRPRAVAPPTQRGGPTVQGTPTPPATNAVAGAPANSVGGGGITPPRGKLGGGRPATGTPTPPATNTVAGAPVNTGGGAGITPPRGKPGGGTPATGTPAAAGPGNTIGTPATNVPAGGGNPTGGKPPGNPTGGNLTGKGPIGAPTPTPTPGANSTNLNGVPLTNLSVAPGTQPTRPPIKLQGKTPTPRPTPTPTPTPKPLR